jgi:NADH dehydrogenase FAD-containing subunit
VRVVADGDCVLDQFGHAATRRMRDLFESWHAELLLGTRIEGVAAGTVTLADGRTLTSDLIAVVGPLNGPRLAFTRQLTDDHGFLPVGTALRSLYDEHVYAAGDAIAQGRHTWRKNWQLSVRQARTAAANVLHDIKGEPPEDFNGRQDERLSAFSLPDIGGTALLVRNRRLLLAGSMARQIRFGMDKKHFKAYLPGSQPWRHLPR